MIIAQRFTHRDNGGSLHRRGGDRIHGLRHGDAHSRDLLRDDGHGGRTSCVERVSFQLTPFFPTRQKFVLRLPEVSFGNTKRTVQSIPPFLNLSHPAV